MDEARARQLLDDERSRVEGLLRDLTEAADEDRATTRETGDIADPAQPLTDEQGADAVAAGLRERLAAIERAEARLAEGTYGALGAERHADTRRSSRGGPRGGVDRGGSGLSGLTQRSVS